MWAGSTGRLEMTELGDCLSVRNREHSQQSGGIWKSGAISII